MDMRTPGGIIGAVLRFLFTIILAVLISCLFMNRTLELSGIPQVQSMYHELTEKVARTEEDLKNTTNILRAHADSETTKPEASEITADNILLGKKIVYAGDSISGSRESNGGGYPALIAARSGCVYENFAHGGARLCSSRDNPSVVDTLADLPSDGDLYCFQGGINDFWGNTPLGDVIPNDYSGTYDTNTICGALETIFTYCLENFPGKPVCFVITHKVQNTATAANANGDTFADYREAMIRVCHKYSIPYYDAFNESGLNGWNQTQSELYLTGNSGNTPDGIHPNAEGYARYYVPQLIDLFRKIMPVAVEPQA